MSEQSPGPGWWLASDGRWYSPDQNPTVPPPPPTAAGLSGAEESGAVDERSTVEWSDLEQVRRESNLNAQLVAVGVFVAAAVIFLVAVLALRGDGDRDYDADIRTNFLLECQRTGGPRSYCVDVLECIEGELSQDEFAAEERLFLMGTPSDRLRRVLAECGT